MRATNRKRSFLSESGRIIIYFIAGFGVADMAMAQKIDVRGRIADKSTGEPVPFASLYFPVAKTGGIADENGIFNFSLPVPDTLKISAVGYRVEALEVAASADLVIQMEQSSTDLQELTVVGYKDPGRALMKKVLAHKPVNDPDRLNTFTRHEYTKTEVDLLNLSGHSGKGTLGRAARMYERFAGDSTVAGTLPLYFAEQYSSFFHAKTGNTSTRKTLAGKALNLSTDQLAPKFEKFLIVPSIYDGIIPVLKTSFVGPVSALGLGFYHFDIIDTLAAGPGRIFRVRFTPRSSAENTFSGVMSIQDDTYAITQVSMQTSVGANLNFIRTLKIDQRYRPLPYPEGDASGRPEQLPDSVWMISRNEVTIVFHNGLQLLGLPVRPDTTGKQVVLTSRSLFSDFRLNTGPPAIESSVEDSGKMLDSTQRLVPLTAGERAIYQTVDSLKKDRVFNRDVRLTTLFSTGYWDFGNFIRIGPLSSLLSSNYAEGLRIRVNVWTMEGFSRKWNLNGHFAYGTRDHKWKARLGVKYVPSRSPYRKTELLWRQDYDLMTENDDEMDMDNVFSLGLRKKLPAYQVFTRQFKLLQEYELNQSWSAKLFLSYRKMTPTFVLNYYPDGSPDTGTGAQHDLAATEVGFNLRYGHNERTTMLNYDKIRVFTRFPVLNFGVTRGLEILPASYFGYTRLSVDVAHEFSMPIKGSFYYNLNAGKVFGSVPYLLLFNPRGNPYYISSKYAFCNMRPYEFSADRYASLMTRYSLGGLLLDHIPLFGKLNIRERLLANFYWGDMTASNKELNRLNPVQSVGRTPYAEAGFGLENILNVLSVDAVWRLNYNGGRPVSGPGIFTGLKIVF